MTLRFGIITLSDRSSRAANAKTFLDLLSPPSSKPKLLGFKATHPT